MSKPLFLRPPEVLRERLAKSAEGNGQSINQRAVTLLEGALLIEEQGYREAALQRAVMALRDAGIDESVIQAALRMLRSG